MTKEPAFYFQDNQGVIHPGSATDFKQLTGAEWLDEMKLEANFFYAPIQPTEEEMALISFLLPLYEKYLKEKPPLCIKEGAFPGAHSLTALEHISQGSLVTEYLGEWIPQAKEHSSYRFGPIDGLKLRNCAALVEDGFPNLAAYHLFDIEGLPMRIIFIALEDIPKGSALAIHYGMNHSVKTGRRIEYRLKEMIQFFKQHPLKEIFSKIKSMHMLKRQNLGWDRSLELDHLIAKVQYLYHTPSALILLLLNNTLSVEDVFAYFNKIDIRLYLLGFGLKPNRRQEEILHSLHVIQNYFLGKREKDLQILEALEAYPLNQVCFLMEQP